jgi:hypothetical protein
MLEKIRTFFGKERGLHGDRRTIVSQGSAWYCTDCRLIFLSKSESEKHSCVYTLTDSIVAMRKKDEESR